MWQYHGSGGGYWLFSLIAGITLYLALPHLIVAFQILLLVVALLAVLAAPVVGVYVTRLIVRYQEKKRRPRSLRGPMYADYCYYI